MINNILSILATLILFLFGYFSFGLFILKKLKLKFSILEEIVLSTMLSISLLTTIIAIFGQFFNTNSYYIFLFAVFFGVVQFKKINNYFKFLLFKIKRNKLITLFFVLTVVIFSSTIIFSRTLEDGSISFQEVHDSVWHISLIRNLQNSIPPLHPSDPSIVLNNYHYFYDLFLAGLAKFSGISLFNLYYQLSVIFLGLLLVLSAYILGNKLVNKFAGYYLVGFTIFAGSFAYLIPLFIPGQAWGESSFWVSQTLVMIVNPQIIYTLALSYVFIFLLTILLKTNHRDSMYLKLHGLIIVLVATSIGFKSYSWLILSFIYGIFLLVELIRYKSLKIIFIGLLYLIVSLPVVWLITHFNGNSFFYKPLWYTDSMIESPDRVNYLKWKLLQDHYLSKNNWIRYYLIEIQKIIIFYVGNLGIRSLFFGLPIIFFLRKNKKNLSIIFYLFIGFLFSSIFPLIFLQKGTVWNSIQFWYYALIFANVLVVLFLSESLKNKSKLVIAFITLLLLALSIPTSIKTIIDKSKKPFVLGNLEVSYLKQKKAQEKIMICPERTNLYMTSIVKSLTLAEVYLANPNQLELVGSSQSRVKQFEEIVDNSDVAKLKKIINDNKITTIICQDKGITSKFSKMLKLKPQKVGSFNVFENLN